MRPDASVRRRVSVFGIGLLLGALLQLHAASAGWRWVPDFLLLYPLLVGLWSPGHDAYVVAMFAGFIRDFAAGRGYGLAMLIALLLAMLGHAFATDRWRPWLARMMCLVLAITPVHRFLMGLFSLILPPRPVVSSFRGAMAWGFSGFGRALAANIVAALLTVLYFVPAFYTRSTESANAGELMWERDRRGQA
ncbi:MAG: rod shape-determining protein MreD [Saccharofermentanales bacterium]|jgi:cell shape-determining protein MreD